MRRWHPVHTHSSVNNNAICIDVEPHIMSQRQGRSDRAITDNIITSEKAGWQCVQRLGHVRTLSSVTTSTRGSKTIIIRIDVG